MVTKAAVVVMSAMSAMGCVHRSMLTSGRPPFTCPTTLMPSAARPKPHTRLMAKVVTVSGPRGRNHFHFLHYHILSNTYAGLLLSHCSLG